MQQEFLFAIIYLFTIFLKCNTLIKGNIHHAPEYLFRFLE